MPYPTAAEIIAGSPELLALTAQQRDALYATSIASIETYCGQSFGSSSTESIDVQSVRSDVLYLPKRLISLTSLVPFQGDPADLAAIAVTHNGGLVEKSVVGAGYYQQALQEISDYSYPTMFPDSWVMVTGSWGWADSPPAVDLALRQDMLDGVSSDDNALTATVNYMRAMGIDRISQGNLDLALSPMPTLSPTVAGLLDPYVFLGTPSGAAGVTGALPFTSSGPLKQRPNTVFDNDVPCTVWPTGPRVTQSGVLFDHQGEAPLSFYENLRQPNRLLVIDGEEYAIVDCQKNIFLPHTALVLRRVESSGL